MDFFFNLREREEGRERGTSICCSTYWCIHCSLLVCAPIGDWSHNLGIWGQCSNQLSYQPGPYFLHFFMLILEAEEFKNCPPFHCTFSSLVHTRCHPCLFLESDFFSTQLPPPPAQEFWPIGLHWGTDRGICFQKLFGDSNAQPGNHWTSVLLEFLGSFGSEWPVG